MDKPERYVNQPVELDEIIKEKSILDSEIVIPLLEIIKRTSNLYQPYLNFCTTNTTLNSYASLTITYQQFFTEILPLLMHQYTHSLYIDDEYIDQCNQLLHDNRELFDIIPTSFNMLNKTIFFLYNQQERSTKKNKKILKKCENHLKKIKTFHKTPLINLFSYLLYQRSELYKQEIIGYPPKNNLHLFYKTRETIKQLVATNIHLQELGDNFQSNTNTQYNNDEYKVRKVSIIDSAMQDNLFEIVFTTHYRNVVNRDYYLSHIDIYNHLRDHLFSLSFEQKDKQMQKANLLKRIKKDPYGIKLFISTGRTLNKIVTQRLQNNYGSTV